MDIASHLERLSEEQRARLAQRIQTTLTTAPQGAEGGHPARKRLVAYVVGQVPALKPTDLRQYLTEHLPDYMVPQRVVLMEALPRTPNGKINRMALPAPEAVSPDLEDAFVGPRNEVEEKLAKIWAAVLGLDAVGIYDNFFELGGDSILSIQIISRAHQAGLSLSPNQIFKQPTVAELAAVVGMGIQKETEQGAIDGAVPLTPIQHWFFEKKRIDPHHWNQFFLLQLLPGTDPRSLAAALSDVVGHHDALRLRFRDTGDGWEQAHGEVDRNVPFEVVDLSSSTREAQVLSIDATVERSQTRFNLAECPLLRGIFFYCGGDFPPVLLLTVHHLVIDTVSWGILLEDLQTVYLQYRNQETVQLLPKTTSFKQWAEALVDLASSDRLQQEKAYWLEQSVASAFVLPLDEVMGENTSTSVHTLSVTLDDEETKSLLQEVPAAYQTQINEVLLTALVKGFGKWTGRASLLLGQEGHGREEISGDIDVSRTIGWFTSFFPVLLNLPDSGDPGGALVAVKEQVRQIPGRGIGFGVLRYLSEDQELVTGLKALPEPQVLFNYLGRMDHFSESDKLFHPLQPLSLSYSPRQPRSHVLEINAAIEQGCLIMRWSYSTHLHRPATIEQVAQDTIDALRALIAHCLSPEAGRFTPSDFPDAGLDQDALDSFLNRFS